jgi:hypothetical protein
MDKYYDYAQEKYVEGDPMTALTAQILGLEMLKRKAHESAERRKRENAKRAAEDKTRSYKIIKYKDIQYIRKFINDSLKKADTWMDRLRLYNELFVDYLNRKSYELKMWYKPEFYTLNLKEYKEIVKYELSLKEAKH